MIVSGFLNHFFARFLMIILIFQSIISYGQQSTVDSLENRLKKSSINSERIKLLNELSFQTAYSNREESIEYANSALQLAEQSDDGHGKAIAQIRIGAYFKSISSYDSALSHYSLALNYGQQNNDYMVDMQALAHIGAVNRSQSNYTNALKNLNTSLKIARDHKDLYWEAFALNIMGLVYQEKGNYDSSLVLSQKALEIRKTLKSRVDIAASLGNVGLVYDYMGDFPKAHKYYFESLEMNKSLGNTHGAAINWNNIGIVYSFEGKSEKALEAFQKALALHTQNGNKLLMVGSLDNIGLNYDERGMYVKALEIFQQALEIREELGNKTGIATSLMNIADIYKIQKRDSLAIIQVESAKALFEEIGDQYGLANANHSLGRMYSGIKEYDQALFYFENALEIRTSINNKDGIIRALNAIGSVHQINKDFIKAKESYQKALNLGLDTGSKFLQFFSYKGLGRAYLGLKNTQSAMLNAEKAYELVKGSSSLSRLRDIHRLLANIYEETGDFKKAHLNFTAHATLKDSILNQETTKQLAQMQVQFDTERKERMLIEKENEIALLDASGKFRKRITWISAIAVLLLFGIIIAYRARGFALKEKNIHQQYSSLLLQANEDERKRISRDLHDSVGQSLMFIKNKLVLSQDDDSVSMVSKALEEVRTISKALHPVVLENLGLTASITKLVNDVDEASEIFFNAEIENIDGIFSKDHELQIYRIVQESLNNMMKHSQTESAMVKVSNESKRVIVLVKDYGVGFDLTKNEGVGNGLGMKTLKERTQLLGAKIFIESVKNSGTTLNLIIEK